MRMTSRSPRKRRITAGKWPRTSEQSGPIKIPIVKKIHPFFLSILSGLLLFAAWPVSPLTFLIFVAFVPLLWLEQQATRGIRFFRWIYLSLLIWNLTTTWWVCNSTLPGGIAAILANSLLMCLPWIGFYNVKKRL